MWDNSGKWLSSSLAKVGGFCRWFPNNLTGRDGGGLVERIGFVKLLFPPSSNLVWILKRTFGESFRRVLTDSWECQNLQSHQQCHHWMKLLSFTGSSLEVQMIKNLPAMQKTQVWSLSREDPLERDMTTHSSILARKVPRTEEPGGLQTMGSQRVRHDWATNAHKVSPCARHRGGQGGFGDIDPSWHLENHKWKDTDYKRLFHFCHSFRS